MNGRYLAIVEHAHRGDVEAQYADAFYLARELNRQLGFDLFLRGDAVASVVRAAPRAPLVVADRTIDTLPDPRRSIRTLVDDGVYVRVEREALAERGIAPESLLPGVTVVDRAAMARRWPTYRAIWFL